MRGRDHPGQRTVGRYRLDGEVGRGGMGVVYAAYDLQQGRPVALKVISPEIGRDVGFAARFRREARIAVSFEHPHVVPVYETGQDGDTLFIAMRRIDGEDLGEVVRNEGPLEVARVVRLARQIAMALDAAHARGIVHRDVKPANVLLAEMGDEEHAYLTDFGLAREAGSETGLTNTGQWMGTADYVAPEQIEGGTVSARTDVYSLGCVLFELLTGDVPFEGILIRKLLAHSRDALPSIGSVAGPRSARLDAVLARATQKDPERRFLSAGDLSRALAAAAAGAPAPASEQSVATGAALRGLRTDCAGLGRERRRAASAADVNTPTPHNGALADDDDIVVELRPAASEEHTAPPEPTPAQSIPAEPPPTSERRPQVQIMFIAMVVTLSVVAVGFVVTQNLSSNGGKVANSGPPASANGYPDAGRTAALIREGREAAARRAAADKAADRRAARRRARATRPPSATDRHPAASAGGLSAPPAPQSPPVRHTPPPPARSAPPPPQPPTQSSRVWPGGPGFTTILASVRSEAAAMRVATAASTRGLDAGVLFSSDYGRLQPGHWVVFSGKTSSKSEADGRTARARKLGYATAYTRCVSEDSVDACEDSE